MAIEYGMSADEFWKDDPQLFVSYRTSFINKKERQKEEVDYISWLNGLYVYDGNSKLVDGLRQVIFNGFASFSTKPKYDQHEIKQYTMKPYGEMQKEKTKVKEETNSYREYQNSIIYFGSLKQIYLNKISKEKGE